MHPNLFKLVYPPRGPFYAFYAFYAWWLHFPQLGALDEGTSRPTSRKYDQALDESARAKMLSATDMNNQSQPSFT